MADETRQTTWKEIWRKKGRTPVDRIELQRLIAIDGFDTGAGYFPVESWLAYVAATSERLALRKGQKLLEVGCGAGAFLLPIHQSGVSVFGVDYSEELIGISMRAMPEGVFKVSDADALPFESGVFDAVVSNGVFFYFDSLAYADRAVREIARVLKRGGRGALLDINDAEREQVAIATRVKELGEEKYRELYLATGLKQLYYRKSWFAELARQCGLGMEIADQDIEGYKNSAYRFNVFLEKRA